METYRERLTWPLWLHGAVVLVWGAAFVGLVLLLLRHGPRIDQAVAAAILLVVAYVWWRVRHLDVVAGAEALEFGFGGGRRRVPADRIVSAEPEEYSAVRYMGWGYRLGWDKGERACSVLGYPRGVRVCFDDERGRRWNVFLSCRSPESVVQALGRKET